jgi:hypothetical protein
MQANEILRNDTIAVRRSNERKFREGLVQDVQVQSFAGFESISALIAFDKTTEVVDLSTANWKLVWRLEEAN